MSVKHLVAVVVWACAVTASAQPSAPSAKEATARSSTLSETERDEYFERAGMRIAELIDRQHADQVWEASSAVNKAAITRAAFQQAVSEGRRFKGAPLSRTVTSVTYMQSDGKSLPKGSFANVTFSTRFANQTEATTELVSFHLDGDEAWRVSGYVVR